MKKWKPAPSESETDLKSRWGQDIPYYDEGDPKYIPISDDWIPIPIIVNDKEYKKQKSIVEKALTQPVGVRAIRKLAAPARKKVLVKKLEIEKEVENEE